MSEELRRALYANSAISLDVEIIVPDLVGTTEILREEHREHLCRHLPARAEGYLWTLVFSTSQHGFSLNSMYRKMAKVESPILLVIEDTEGNVKLFVFQNNSSTQQQNLPPIVLRHYWHCRCLVHLLPVRFT